MPIGSWLRKELRFLIEEYLRKDRIEKQGLFDPRVISELVSSHLSGVKTLHGSYGI